MIPELAASESNSCTNCQNQTCQERYWNVYSMLLNSFSHRPLRSIVIHIARPCLPGFWADPTLAVFAGITLGCGKLSNHHLGRNQWRVQTYWSRWSCQKMGGKEIKTKHELWQIEQSIEVSCKFLGLFRYEFVQLICFSILIWFLIWVQKISNAISKLHTPHSGVN